MKSQVVLDVLLSCVHREQDQTSGKYLKIRFLVVLNFLEICLGASSSDTLLFYYHVVLSRLSIYFLVAVHCIDFILSVSALSPLPSSTALEMMPDTATQPVGANVATHPAIRPSPRTVLQYPGSAVTIRGMSAEEDAKNLFPLVNAQHNASIWTYMFDDPPETVEELHQMMSTKAQATDPVFYTIDIDGVGPVGWASLMRVDEKQRVVELGHILLTKHLQRTTDSTRVMYLFLQHAFETLGYRRVEWKCDALNAPSRRAAQRLGFQYEGIFR